MLLHWGLNVLLFTAQVPRFEFMGGFHGNALVRPKPVRGPIAPGRVWGLEGSSLRAARELLNMLSCGPWGLGENCSGLFLQL